MKNFVMAEKKTRNRMFSRTYKALSSCSSCSWGLLEDLSAYSWVQYDVRSCEPWKELHLSHWDFPPDHLLVSIGTVAELFSSPLQAPIPTWSAKLELKLDICGEAFRCWKCWPDWEQSVDSCTVKRLFK